MNNVELTLKTLHSCLPITDSTLLMELKSSLFSTSIQMSYFPARAGVNENVRLETLSDDACILLSSSLYLTQAIVISLQPGFNF